MERKILTVTWVDILIILSVIGLFLAVLLPRILQERKKAEDENRPVPMKVKQAMVTYISMSGLEPTGPYKDYAFENRPVFASPMVEAEKAIP